jgi:hypothetical protein
MEDFITIVNANPIPHEIFVELVGLANDAYAGKRQTIPPDAERCFESLSQTPANRHHAGHFWGNLTVLG